VSLRRRAPLGGRCQNRVLSGRLDGFGLTRTPQPAFLLSIMRILRYFLFLDCSEAGDAAVH
jgi:hypothetical protein